MRMAIEHPVGQHTRVAVTAWRFGARNGVQAFFTGHGTPCAIANPVQAHVCGNPVQETRRISRVEPFASFENAKDRRLASSISSSFTLAV